MLPIVKTKAEIIDLGFLRSITKLCDNLRPWCLSCWHNRNIPCSNLSPSAGINLGKFLQILSLLRYGSGLFWTATPGGLGTNQKDGTEYEAYQQLTTIE